MYLLDTNIFLEILLGQNEAAACQQVLEGLNGQAPAWVSSFSMHAIEAIIGARHRKVLEPFLEGCILHPHLNCYFTTLEEELAVARLSSKLPLDFDDCLQYYVAKKKQLTLVTLDRDFKKIKDIPVSHPAEVRF